MRGRTEVRLAGEGGQGLLLAGVILAEAAAVYSGLNAVQTQSYGPEARGGASKSEVIISEEEIDYPKVIEADILLAMSQEACDRYAGNLKREGTLIIDAVQVTRLPLGRAAVQAPITRMAEEATGRRITANVVALGVLVGVTGIVPRQAIEAAVRARAPRGTEEMNCKALAAGLDWAARHQSQGAAA